MSGITFVGKSPELVYEYTHYEVQAKLQAIADLLCDMPAPDCSVPINWGHVGDIQHVNAKLDEIAAFLRR